MWWQMPATQQRLRQAHDAQWVDYTTVIALKITALWMVWTRFAARDDAQMAEFHLFCLSPTKARAYTGRLAFDALHSINMAVCTKRAGHKAFINVDDADAKSRSSVLYL